MSNVKITMPNSLEIQTFTVSVEQKYFGKIVNKRLYGFWYMEGVINVDGEHKLKKRFVRNNGLADWIMLVLTVVSKSEAPKGAKNKIMQGLVGEKSRARKTILDGSDEPFYFPTAWSNTDDS